LPVNGKVNGRTTLLVYYRSFNGEKLRKKEQRVKKNKNVYTKREIFAIFYDRCKN